MYSQHDQGYGRDRYGGGNRGGYGDRSGGYGGYGGGQRNDRYGSDNFGGKLQTVNWEQEMANLPKFEKSICLNLIF